MDCELPEDDFLQQLSNDLEIPMLLEENLSNDREIDNLFEASSFFREFDDWGLEPVFRQDHDSLSQVSFIKEEIKIEPDTLPSSPSSLSHDSWSSTDSKHNILETPPISPSQSSSGSPPRTPSPPSPQPPPREPPVLMVGGKPIKIVPLKHNSKLGENKPKILLQGQNLILQPRPISMTPITIKGNNNGQKTLVLSSKNLNTLTSQITGRTTTSGEIRIVNQLSSCIKSAPAAPATSDRQDIQMKALKRQQRMIKNRESACLSRKKKKEYITSLESRISELEKENIKLKTENEVLRARLGQCDGSVTKRPKTVFSVNVKKTAILAVLLVVSVNLGSLSFLSKGRSGADAVLSVPDVTLSRHGSRRLLWEDSELHNVTTSSTSQYNQQPTCPLHINQTESLRLNSELRRWIGAEKPQYNNNSDKDSDNDLVDLQPTKESQLMLRQPSSSSVIPRRRKLKLSRKEVQETQLMMPNAGLLEALHRRDDTFYVVSFSGDHLLLPALAHNNSVRPKMSLVLPALPFNTSVDTAASVTMMQIDCEVLDTRLVELKERDIPSHLRQAKPASRGPQHKNISTEEEPVRSSYRPYFLRNNFVEPYSPLQHGPRDRRPFP